MEKIYSPNKKYRTRLVKINVDKINTSSSVNEIIIGKIFTLSPNTY
jgi:hypothetical protein